MMVVWSGYRVGMEWVQCSGYGVDTEHVRSGYGAYMEWVWSRYRVGMEQVRSGYDAGIHNYNSTEL